MAATGVTEPDRRVGQAAVRDEPRALVAPGHAPCADDGAFRPAVGRVLALVDESDRRLLVRGERGTIVARMAMHLPRVEAGQEVLLVGARSDWYVVGALSGTGETDSPDGSPVLVTLPATVNGWHAPRGSIRFVAATSVSLGGRRVVVRARRIRLRAAACLRRFDAVQRWVRGLVSCGARRVCTQTEADQELLAGRIRKVADEDVAIAGRRIHMN